MIPEAGEIVEVQHWSQLTRPPQHHQPDNAVTVPRSKLAIAVLPL
jgi:hypothetical protein